MGPRASSPGHLRMVLRTSLGVIIILTLLVIIQGSIPKTNTDREVTGDDLNVGDINLASIGDTGIRAIVKRNADANVGKNKSINKKKEKDEKEKSTKKKG